jgi:hypothetical protein
MQGDTHPSHPVTRSPLAALTMIASATALSLLVGCSPDQAEGYTPGGPFDLRIFDWVRPSPSYIHANTVGPNRYTIEGAEVNDSAGIIQALTGSYETGDAVLSWSATFKEQPDENPWHTTEGYWLVLSDGPMPLSLGDQTVQFFFDASGDEPVLTGYVYNGAGNASSFMDGSSAPGVQPPQRIFTSQGGGFPIRDLTVERQGPVTTMRFAMDASVINDYMPTGSPSTWEGVGFTETIGVWMHPLTNIESAYDGDGYLEQFDYDRAGWWDGEDLDVNFSVACCMDDGGCVDLMLGECEAAGGISYGDLTSCAGAICPPATGTDCCDGDKPQVLTMQYTGDGCDMMMHAQDAKKVACDGDPGGLPLVHVIASDKDDPDHEKAKVYFEGDVAPGDLFDISAAFAGEKKLKSAIHVHVLDLDGNPVQAIEFHASCSQPLRTGDQFGGVRLVGCGDDTGSDGHGDDGHADDGHADDPGALQDDCDLGKPRQLVFRYVGSGCDEMDHAQDDEKAVCVGDAALPGMVYIVSSDSEEPDDDGANVWYEGIVAIDDQLTLDVATAGQSKFKSRTFVYVMDLTGEVLQSIEFHTSCSQPLREGDQFGSIVLEDFIPD